MKPCRKQAFSHCHGVVGLASVRRSIEVLVVPRDEGLQTPIASLCLNYWRPWDTNGIHSGRLLVLASCHTSFCAWDTVVLLGKQGSTLHFEAGGAQRNPEL